MNYFKFGIILCFVVAISCKSNPSTDLTIIIANNEKHEGYDSTEYPLGLYTKEYYKGEADFAKEQLEKL